jgi:cytochrome P450
MFGEGIFTQDGDAWKHSRDILRPQLFHRKYENLEVFRGSIDDLLEALPSAGVVDLQPLFFRLTLDVTAAFLFGESTKSLRSPSVAGEDTFASAFDTAQKYVAKRFRLLDLYWLIGGKEFRQACERVHRFADQIIDRNLSSDECSEEKKDNFLYSVNKEIADRIALRGQIVNILTAGRDTTACLLSWTL